MIVTLSARHMDVTPTLRSYAEQKAGKLEKYYDRIQEIEVIFDASNGKVKVELIVNEPPVAPGRSMPFFCHWSVGSG